MSRYRVFVYGTLKRGEPNYHVIGNPASGVSQFVGEGKTVAKYPLVAAAPWYNPYLLPAENQEEAKQVQGEVYSVDDIVLTQLDKLELHPHWYTRQPTEILLNSGEQSTCEVYFLLNFKPDLLKLKFLSNYHHKSDDHPHYVPKEKRQFSETVIDVMKLCKDINEHAIKAVEEMLKVS